MFHLQSSPLHAALSSSEAPLMSRESPLVSGGAHLYLSPLPGVPRPDTTKPPVSPRPRRSHSLNMFFNKGELEKIRVLTVCNCSHFVIESHRGVYLRQETNIFFNLIFRFVPEVIIDSSGIEILLFPGSNTKRRL